MSAIPKLYHTPDRSTIICSASFDFFPCTAGGIASYTAILLFCIVKIV